MLPELGLWRTIQVAALINGLVFLAAWALSRSASMQRESPTRPPDAVVEGAARSRLILLLILGSGVASFTYEVVWVRLLGHVLGGSVYAFATMLASFLLGIALGSAVASRFATTRRRASLGFALAQLAIAATSLGAYMFANFIPGLNVAWSSPGSAVSGGGVLVAMLVLFPAATFVGATFPLAVRLFARSEAEAGRAAASVYAANTLGSIIGAVGAGFFIVPWLGYSGTFAACAGLNLALAGLAAVGLQPRRPTLALVASALMMLVVAVPLPTPWAVLQNTSLRWLIGSQTEVEYYAVGRSATVLMLAQPPRWMLRSNGLPEASIDRPLVSHRRYILAVRILREVEVSSGRGELGALLRREGLYSSNLTAWRKQRERGELEGLSRKRGPAPKPRNLLADRVRALERENARLKARAERAEGLVELQKKVSEILGIELKHNGEKD